MNISRTKLPVLLAGRLYERYGTLHPIPDGDSYGAYTELLDGRLDTYKQDIEKAAASMTICLFSCLYSA